MEHSEKIPFAFETPLNIKSITDPAFRVQLTVAGVISNDSILVRGPAFEREDQISGRIGEDILCTYVCEGCLYRFKSRFKQVLYKGLVSIEYPGKFETQQLRRQCRIKLNLPAETVIGGEKSLHVEIRDISETGCRLKLPGLLPFAQGAPVFLTFRLPNEELIEYLECTIMNMRHAEKTTHAGVGFSGPTSEVEKIRKFCEMCSYFKV